MPSAFSADLKAFYFHDSVRTAPGTSTQARQETPSSGQKASLGGYSPYSRPALPHRTRLSSFHRRCRCEHPHLFVRSRSHAHQKPLPNHCPASHLDGRANLARLQLIRLMHPLRCPRPSNNWLPSFLVPSPALNAPPRAGFIRGSISQIKLAPAEDCGLFRH